MSKVSPESFDKICGAISKRINEKNKSYSMVFVGEPGSGKSLAACAVASRVDPSFAKNPRVVYNTKDFIKQLSSMGKGQAIIYDEIGLGAAARTFMSQANLMMSAVSQILRFKNILVIFTTPSISFFDVNVRMLLNAIVKMKNIDYEHQVTYAKYNVIQISNSGNLVYNDFIFYTPDGGRNVIDPFIIPKPSPEIAVWYDKVSIEFKNQTIKELFAKLDGEGVETEEGRISHSELRRVYSQANVCVKLIEYIHKTHTWKELSEISGIQDRTLRTWIGPGKLAAPPLNEE